MSRRVLFVLQPSSNGTINIRSIHGSLFGTAVYDHRLAAVEEVQQAVIHSLMSTPQLVNSVAEEIAFRPTKLMTCFLKPAHAIEQLVSGADRHGLDPEQRRRNAALGIEPDVRPRHPVTYFTIL